MSTQNNVRETGSFSTRTIVNFPFLTGESLGELIDTLGFKMGLAELRFCQNAFRNNKLNNPTINELKIIDRVFYDNSKRHSSALIASFLTNEKLVADTYADLMARRKAVAPDYSAPCSIEDMLDILPKYLGQKASCNISLFGGKNRNAEISAVGYKKIAETGSGDLHCSAGINIKGASKATASNGNVIYAVLKSFNNFQDFENRLESLLSYSEVQKYAKQTLVFDDESVITLLAGFGGVRLNTLHFEGKDGAISPFELLCEGDTGIITVFDKSESVDMLLTAQLFGLRVVPLGHITQSQTIDGISVSGEHLSLSIPFLRSLKISRPMVCEADAEKPNITDNSNSVYINVNGDKYRMNSAICGGENHFMAGFNSVLYSYSLCVASSANEPTGTGTYTLPLKFPTEKELGVAAEIVLGAYRAECELALSDTAPKIQIGSKPSLSFHTLSKISVAIPAKFVGKESKIYYLEPAYGEDGLPNFENLRQMHKYINSLAERGAVLSIHPTTDDIDTALKQMSETVTPRLIETQMPTSRYGGFIIESAEDIQGVLVGRISQESPQSPI